MHINKTININRAAPISNSWPSLAKLSANVEGRAVGKNEIENKENVLKSKHSVETERIKKMQKRNPHFLYLNNQYYCIKCTKTNT